MESSNLPAVQAIDHGFEPDLEVKRLVEAAREAKDQYLAHKKTKNRRLQSWAALLFIASGPCVAARPIPTKL
jgi:hypothetical protein